MRSALAKWRRCQACCVASANGCCSSEQPPAQRCSGAFLKLPSSCSAVLSRAERRPAEKVSTHSAPWSPWRCLCHRSVITEQSGGLQPAAGATPARGREGHWVMCVLRQLSAALKIARGEHREAVSARKAEATSRAGRTLSRAFWLLCSLPARVSPPFGTRGALRTGQADQGAPRATLACPRLIVPVTGCSRRQPRAAVASHHSAPTVLRSCCSQTIPCICGASHCSFACRNRLDGSPAACGRGAALPG